jgi:hypothetical protein
MKRSTRPSRRVATGSQHTGSEAQHVAVFADVVTLRGKHPTRGVTTDSAGNEELAMQEGVLTVPPMSLTGAQSTPAQAASRHRSALAHTASCWGSHSHTKYTEIMQLTVEENGWCGNGKSITWYGGASYRWVAYTGNCIVNVSTNYSWEVPYSWNGATRTTGFKVVR